MFAHQFFFVVLGIFQRWDRPFIPRIPRRYGHISQVTSSFGALDRAILELAVEGFGRQFQFADQVWAGDIWPGGKGFIPTLAGETVPGADHLADVAAENPIS